MIALDTTKHKAICEDAKLSESLFAWSLIPKFLDWIQQFLVEDGYMLHAAVITSLAAAESIHVPIESRARTLFAEVACKRANVEKPDEREEFADPVLKRSSGQTPFVVCF
jgi:hypothetical protein